MELLEQLKQLTEPITLEEKVNGEWNKAQQLYVMVDKVNLQAKIGITDRAVNKRLREVKGAFRNAGMDDSGLFVLWNETLSFAERKEGQIHKLLNQWRFGGGKETHPTGGTEFFSLVKANHLNEEMLNAIGAITDFSVDELCSVIGKKIQPPYVWTNETTRQDAYDNFDDIKNQLTQFFIPSVGKVIFNGNHNLFVWLSSNYFKFQECPFTSEHNEGITYFYFTNHNHKIKVGIQETLSDDVFFRVWINDFSGEGEPLLVPSYDNSLNSQMKAITDAYSIISEMAEKTQHPWWEQVLSVFS